MQKDYVRLILSDLHLGSAYCREEDLILFLSEVQFDEIILAGDIIEFLRHPIFTEKTYEIFKYLSELNKKIVYIVGNHDDAFKSFIGKKISNIEFKEEYNFEYGGRKFRIEHGDKYEKGVVKARYFMMLLSIIQDYVERIFKIDVTTWWANQQIKKRKLKRIWDLVKWNSECDVLIIGHTHNPEVLIWVDKDETIKTYVNTGDWIEHTTYVIIKDGQIRLKNWKQ